MDLDELLEETLEYTNMLIEIAIQQESARDLGKLCNDISRFYRALGIYDLLMHADVDGYYYGLIQSGLARKYYLDRCANENVVDDPERMASFTDPFFDAVAAGEFNLAMEIARLSPERWMEGYEYEDDFAYARFFYEWIGSDESELRNRQALDRFEKAVTGQTAERLAVCRALVEKDQATFDDAFADLLDANVDRMENLADPEIDSILAQEYTFPANRWIFVEGLAILRIAEHVGMSVEEEYERCPSIARAPASAPFVSDSCPNLALS